jgi:phage baseplate assembly protein W
MTIDVDIYGSDIALENGDIVSGFSGDLQYVSELDNLSQAIIDALTTEKGSLYYNPDYGINLNGVVGEKNIALARERLRTEISNVLKAEPRIKTIDNLTVEQDSDNISQLNVSITVTPITTDSTIAINLVYPYSTIKDTTNTILNEEQVSTNSLTVYTEYPIYDIIGVYLSTDPNKTGTDYYSGGSIDGNQITLGKELPGAYSTVLVDYKTISIPMTNVQITQISEERITSSDGSTLETKYLIYDISGIWYVSDTDKTNNVLDDNCSFAQKTITLSDAVSAQQDDVFAVDYSTKLDEII